MNRLEVSGAVRPIYESLGVKRLINNSEECTFSDKRNVCTLTVVQRNAL